MLTDAELVLHAGLQDFVGGDVSCCGLAVPSDESLVVEASHFAYPDMGILRNAMVVLSKDVFNVCF